MSEICGVLGLTLAIDQQQLVILVVRDDLLETTEKLLVLLALLSEGVAARLLQEADGDVIDLLSV